MTKVAEGRDNDQGQVQIETDSDAPDVKTMIILQRTVQTLMQQKRTSQIKCNNTWTQ